MRDGMWAISFRCKRSAEWFGEYEWEETHTVIAANLHDAIAKAAGMSGAEQIEEVLDIETMMAPGRGNPWSKDTWNVTEQGRMFRDNPALAQVLSAAAGGAMAASVLEEEEEPPIGYRAENPWKKESWDPDEQARLWKEAPVMAGRLQREALPVGDEYEI